MAHFSSKKESFTRVQQLMHHILGEKTNLLFLYDKRLTRNMQASFDYRFENGVSDIKIMLGFIFKKEVHVIPKQMSMDRTKPLETLSLIVHNWLTEDFISITC